MKNLISMNEVLYYTGNELKVDGSQILAAIPRVQMTNLPQFMGMRLALLFVADRITNEWDAQAEYDPGDQVIANGFGWVATQPSTGQIPPAYPPPIADPSAYWQYQPPFASERFRLLWEMGMGQIFSYWVMVQCIPFINLKLSSGGAQTSFSSTSTNAGVDGGNRLNDDINTIVQSAVIGLYTWLYFTDGNDPAPRDLFPEWIYQRAQPAFLSGINITPDNYGYNWPGFGGPSPFY